KSESVSWSHPHLPIAVESSGNCEFSSSPEIKQLRSLLLYDLCRFLTIGNMELTVQLDCQLADKLINPSSSSVATDDDRQVLNSLLASAFVTVHLVRVIKSCRNLTVSFKQGEAAKISVIEGEGDVILSGPLHIFHYRLNDAELAAELEASVKLYAQNSKSVSFLCVLFNEFDVNERYLTEKMRQDSMSRLPNFGTARVKLDSTPGMLKIDISTFDHGHENQFLHLTSFSAEEALQEFGDDRFLHIVVPVCQKLAAQMEFICECFFVPCRTTLELMQASETDNVVQAVASSEEHVESTSLNELQTMQPFLNNCQMVFPNRTALHCAAAASIADFSAGTGTHLDCAEILISHQADLSLKDSRDQTALHCAVLSNNGQLATLLLKQSTVEIDCQDENGKTALLIAVENEMADVVKFLLENGADWSQADLKQATPLSVALERGNPDVVRAVLEYDSELIHDGNWDRYASCYQTARDASHRDESVKLSNLVCLGKSTELMEALSAGSAEANLRMSAKLEYRDWRLRTPLMWAALGCWKPTTKHVECAKLLLEAGANPNAADMDGNTALHLAAAASNADVIRLLLDAGASVRRYNRQGQTPSMVAEKIETDNKEILLMLREAELLELRNTWLQRREKDPASSSSIEAETEHTKRMIELVRKVQLDQDRLDEKSYEDSASLTDESPIVETKLENNDFSLLNLNDFELEADWDKISPKVEDLTADDHYKSYQEVTRLRYTENLEDYLPSHISNESVQEATDESYKSKTSDDVEFSVFKDTSLSHCCSEASFNFAPRSLPSNSLSYQLNFLFQDEKSAGSQVSASRSFGN
uniref:ANK_REP_REGION domain-containing protein n=1 Tax=Macrostomum lignano TaxID=282301 RepID=A0A1I8HCJ7_9PLAT